MPQQTRDHTLADLRAERSRRGRLDALLRHGRRRRSALIVASALLLCGGACEDRSRAAGVEPASRPPPPPLQNVGPASWTPGRWNVNAWGPIAGQALPFAADHVARVGSDIVLTLDAVGAAQVQTTDVYDRGEARARMTLPPLSPGQDAAFFLYSGDGDELDFEFLAKGLWLCVHHGGKQFGKFLDSRNHGGETVQPSVVWSSQDVHFSLDGAEVWRVTTTDLPKGMALPASGMQVFFSNSAFERNPFFGNFENLAIGERRRMVVQGVGLPETMKS